MNEAIELFTGAPAVPVLHPFAGSDGIARSLNRARIVALPGIAVDEGVLGHSASALLSADAARSLIRDAAGPLGLDAADPELLRSFSRCFDDPAARGAAERVAERIGRRLGFLLLMLTRGDAANRAARPDWRDEHWAYWQTVERVIIGGGLWAGRLGEFALPAARSVLTAGESKLFVQRSSLGDAIALAGLARHAPPDTRRALLFDFGQTKVKCGQATYEDGVVKGLALRPPLPAPCSVASRAEGSPEETRSRWRRMAAIITGEWAVLIPKGEESSTAIGLCMATHLRDGHPFPTDRGCYGRLQDLAPHLATYLRDEMEARIGRFRAFALLHDGLAAGSAYAGEPHTVVLTLGTAIGAGYVVPRNGLRSLSDDFTPMGEFAGT